ncbi:MAG TPA: energy-coupling factor ABC transporter permease [Gammaproteobacteria bacterium]
MNLTYALFPGWLHWLATALLVLLLLLALRGAQWHRFRERELLHLILGSCVFLLVLGSLKAGIKPGLTFHLLGATLFMLMYGWQIALLAICLVLTGSTLYGFIEWQAFAINALLMGALPILFSHAIYRLAVGHLPHHFFIYVLVNAFFCAGLAMALTVATATLLLLLLGPYSLDTLLRSYLPFAPFMAFGEAFMTGMLATSMAVMKPHWLITFDERRYIVGK